LFAVGGVAALEGVLEFREQDLHDAGELAAFGVRQMVEAGLQRSARGFCGWGRWDVGGRWAWTEV
jgi:hypothetical protein